MNMFQTIRHILLALAGAGSIAMGIITLCQKDEYYTGYEEGREYLNVSDARPISNQYTIYKIGEELKFRNKIERIGFGSVLTIGGLILLALACPVNKKEEKNIQQQLNP